MSAAQRAYDSLRESIVTTRFAPGAALQEAELAADLGASKTPVREALQRLAIEGLVSVIPRRGYVVRPVGVSDVREVMALREQLEPLCAAGAARHADPAAMDRLDALASAQVAAESEQDRLQAAEAFHLEIVTASRMTRARGILAGLWDETSRLHYLAPGARGHLRSEAEFNAHRDILDAIRSRDPERAALAMRAHLEESNAALVRAVIED